jgi:hypothetical protein
MQEIFTRNYKDLVIFFGFGIQRSHLRNSLKKTPSNKDVISEKDYIIASVELDPTILDYMKNQYQEMSQDKNSNVNNYNFDIKQELGRENIAKLTAYVINNSEDKKQDHEKIFNNFCHNVKAKQDRDGFLKSGLRSICKYGPISAIAFLVAPKIAIAGSFYYIGLGIGSGIMEASRYLCPKYFDKAQKKLNEFDDNNNIGKIVKMPHKLFSRSADLINSSIYKVSSYFSDKIQEYNGQSKVINTIKTISEFCSNSFNKINNYLEPRPIKFYEKDTKGMQISNNENQDQEILISCNLDQNNQQNPQNLINNQKLSIANNNLQRI